jgi:ferric-dicitrate binding protein FerR (iron transport regulator)
MGAEENADAYRKMCALRNYTRDLPEDVQIRSQGTMTRVAGRRQSFWGSSLRAKDTAAYVICAPPVMSLMMHRVDRHGPADSRRQPQLHQQ